LPPLGELDRALFGQPGPPALVDQLQLRSDFSQWAAKVGAVATASLSGADRLPRSVKRPAPGETGGKPQALGAPLGRGPRRQPQQPLGRVHRGWQRILDPVGGRRRSARPARDRRPESSAAANRPLAALPNECFGHGAHGRDCWQAGSGPGRGRAGSRPNFAISPAAERVGERAMRRDSEDAANPQPHQAFSRAASVIGIRLRRADIKPQAWWTAPNARPFLDRPIPRCWSRTGRPARLATPASKPSGSR